MYNNLCDAFKLIARDTWNFIGLHREFGRHANEETITDINVLKLLQLNPRKIKTHTFTKNEESSNGADWEWWFHYNNQWLCFRVQAKVLYLKSNEFKKLHYTKDKVAQTDNLITQALADSQSPKIPLYCLYWQESSNLQNFDSKGRYQDGYQDGYWYGSLDVYRGRYPGRYPGGYWDGYRSKYWHGYRDGYLYGYLNGSESINLMGCSLMSAFDVKRLGKRTKLSEVFNFLKPWHDLVCFKCCGTNGNNDNRLKNIESYAKANFMIENQYFQEFKEKFINKDTKNDNTENIDIPENFIIDTPPDYVLKIYQRDVEDFDEIEAPDKNLGHVMIISLSNEKESRSYND